jgi:hypothetical protein
MRLGCWKICFPYCRFSQFCPRSALASYCPGSIVIAPKTHGRKNEARKTHNNASNNQRFLHELSDDSYRAGSLPYGERFIDLDRSVQRQWLTFLHGMPTINGRLRSYTGRIWNLNKWPVWVGMRRSQAGHDKLSFSQIRHTAALQYSGYTASCEFTWWRHETKQGYEFHRLKFTSLKAENLREHIGPPECLNFALQQWQHKSLL